MKDPLLLQQADGAKNNNGIGVDAALATGTKSGAIRKMSTCKTFFAVAKAYCAIGILIMPRSFVNGGYLLSPLALFTACFFESLCAARLATVAHTQGVYSYALLMEKAVGAKGLVIARVFLAIAHWQFTVGQMTFTLSSL